MPQSTSTLFLFRNQTFRTLWIAALASNFGGLVQAVGAAWMMTSLSDSQSMVALVQSSVTLPIMIFSLLAGVFADNFDRRKVMLIAQSFMLVVSVLLAFMAYEGWLTPCLLLAFTFMIGCGTALHNPSWQASMGDIVSREELSAAVSLNSMGFNLMRSIGPAATLRRAHPGVQEIGGRGLVAIPGLVNAHHHVGLTPFQLGARDQPLELWFPERLAMRDVDPRLDTLFSAFEMLASGVTTVQHLHSRAPGDTEAVIRRSDAIIGAYVELGMRASYSFALRDQNRMIYEADEIFVASLPEELRGPTAAYLAGFGLPLTEQISVFHTLRDRWAKAP